MAWVGIPSACAMPAHEAWRIPSIAHADVARHPRVMAWGDDAACDRHTLHGRSERDGDEREPLLILGWHHSVSSLFKQWCERARVLIRGIEITRENE